MKKISIMKYILLAVLLCTVGVSVTLAKGKTRVRTHVNNYGGTIDGDRYVGGSPGYTTVNAYPYTGYHVAGWSSKTSSGGMKCCSIISGGGAWTNWAYIKTDWGSGYNLSTSTRSGDVYVWFDPNTYTNYLTYDANGGTGAPGRQSAGCTFPNTNPGMQLSYTQPTRTGYTFNGWNWNKNATSGAWGGSWHNVGNTYQAYDQWWTVYAIWKVNQFNVTFDADGGTFEEPGNLGTEHKLTTTYDAYSYCCNTSTVVTKKDYVLEGWYDANGVKVFDVYGNAVQGKYWSKSCTSNQNSWYSTKWCYAGKNGETIALKAKWEKKINKTTNADGTNEIRLDVNTTTTEADIQEVLDSVKTNVQVVDLTTAQNIEDPENAIAIIRESSKVTNNTLVVINDGVTVSADNNENLLIKKTTTSGGETTDTYSCANFAVTDKVDLKVPYAFTADAATYNRSQSSKWGTICVPFKLESTDKIQYYTSGKVDGNNLALVKAATVDAGVPAIYCVKALDTSGTNGETTSKEDLNITYFTRDILSDVKAASGANVVFVGTFTQKVIDADDENFDIFYYKDNKFYKRTSGQEVTIPALRAYIKIAKTSGGSENARSASILGIVENSETTGIDNVNADADVNQAPIFNAAGQRTSGLKNGLNIINGKKVVVK